MDHDEVWNLPSQIENAEAYGIWHFKTDIYNDIYSFDIKLIYYIQKEAVEFWNSITSHPLQLDHKGQPTEE